MATAQDLDVDDDIPRAPPPSPELPHTGNDTYFDFSSIQFLDSSPEPSSPASFHHHSPPTFPLPSMEDDISKIPSHYPTSPPHDIPPGINGMTSNHRSDFRPTFTSSSVPVNCLIDDQRHLPHSYGAAQLLSFMELPGLSEDNHHLRHRKISLKRNHDDLSDDCCYSSSCDPSWMLVEPPPDEGGHKKACQERDAEMGSVQTSPSRHKKLSVPSRLPGRTRDHTTPPPPLVSRLNHLSIGKSVSRQEYDNSWHDNSWHDNSWHGNSLHGNSWHGNAGVGGDDQQMDCSESTGNTVVMVTQNDSTAMDCDHTPFSVTAPSPSHLAPTTRSHTFSFSPTPSSSSFLNPNSLSPYTDQGWLPPSSHQFYSSFHEQSPSLPDGSVNMLSRSL